MPKELLLPEFVRLSSVICGYIGLSSSAKPDSLANLHRPLLFSICHVSIYAFRYRLLLSKGKTLMTTTNDDYPWHYS